MRKLGVPFYAQTDVVAIAKQLIGKIVVTNLDGQLTSGRIVETEAYVAFVDKASHAYNGKRTARNEHMYAPAATAYVYICYGMHQMLNVVTNAADVPDAILIRAIEPMDGIDIMLQRTGKKMLDATLTRGPGNVARALGVKKLHSGLHLLDDEIYLAEDDYVFPPEGISASARIGVSYAGDDAMLPYRFYVKGNKYVSAKPK
ncbi:MAG: DNA-3-methyladenine glycosylase [Chitinophagaceae bacterium]|nr:MAG: DNA-3-methyladenine glycosylase [Chitinophagaceae bacterium]